MTFCTRSRHLMLNLSKCRSIGTVSVKKHTGIKPSGKPGPLKTVSTLDEGHHGQGQGPEKINMEEITQRVIGWRRKEEFHYNENGPPEGEEEREDRRNAHNYRRLYPWKSKEELAAYLCHQIVHQQDDVIAINKPYGVGARNIVQRRDDNIEILKRSGKEVPKVDPENDPLHHIRGTGSCPYTLEDVVPLLRQKLGIPELQLLKSVDKFNSGIVIFSTTKTAADKIRKSITSNKSLGVRTYSFYVISTNISSKFQPTGTVLNERVAITLAEHPVTKVTHPVIVRDFSKKRAREAQSDIKPVSLDLTVLDKNPRLNVCLSRIDTTSTNNNFLRIYYTNIVAPILGDHLYGSRVAKVGGVMVPVPPAMARIGVGHQILTQDVISAVRLRALDDSILIPLHAHLQTFTLGNFYGKGKHLHVTAPPPNIFEWTCKQLSLRIPQTSRIIKTELST